MSHSAWGHHSSAPNRWASQSALPVWSGGKWVTSTRRMGRSRSSPAKKPSHRARVGGSPTPVSTTVTPSPSSSSHRLMWLSWNGSGIRIQRMPGATSMLAPPSGGSGQGCTSPGAGAASGCSGSGLMGRSLLPVHVEADLLLALGHRDVTLGRRDDDGLAGGGRPELLGQVHGDGEDVAREAHLDILHRRSPVVRISMIVPGAPRAAPAGASTPSMICHRTSGGGRNGGPGRRAYSTGAGSGATRSPPSSSPSARAAGGSTRTRRIKGRNRGTIEK